MPIFGQAGLFVRSDFWLAVIALIVVVGMGIWIIWRWRTSLAPEPPRSVAEQIRHYQELADKGQLDPDEFARIKTMLEKQISDGLDGPLDPPRSDQPPDTSIRKM